MSAPADPLNVLVIDDDKHLAETIGESLERRGHACTVATSGKAGAARLDADDFDVVLTDLRMADLDGLAVVRKARDCQPAAEVLVITGFGDVKTAVEAIKLGASHYLQKPIDLAELRAVVDLSAARVRQARENQELKRQLDERFGFEGVVGNSPKMQTLLRYLRSFAPTPAPVLILGENGTGKELVAKALYRNSPRKNKPFVAMNCAALNENLLDDEMFGHEEGSFTGAKGSRKGRFEYANGGTLFLDEIGDMPLALQAKLLRVLENGEVVRIGANAPVKVDVRVLAATNQDLQVAVKDGRFRIDLFHRLNVGRITLPPLRERADDIPLLADHFLKDLGAKYGKTVTLDPHLAREAFRQYSWPGNVRELRNLLESMVVLDVDGKLGPDDLPEDAGIGPADGGSAPVLATGSGTDPLVGRPLREVERYYMQKALELTGGNREEASRLLGIGERTLYRNIQSWRASGSAPVGE